MSEKRHGALGLDACLVESSASILPRPGFRNSLSKVNIHIMGDAPCKQRFLSTQQTLPSVSSQDRYRIENSMGYWNETTAQLRRRFD